MEHQQWELSKWWLGEVSDDTVPTAECMARVPLLCFTLATHMMPSGDAWCLRSGPYSPNLVERLSDKSLEWPRAPAFGLTECGQTALPAPF